MLHSSESSSVSESIINQGERGRSPASLLIEPAVEVSSLAASTTQRAFDDLLNLHVSQPADDVASYQRSKLTSRFVDPAVENDYIVFAARYQPTLGSLTLLILGLLSLGQMAATKTFTGQSTSYLVLRHAATASFFALSAAYFFVPRMSFMHKGDSVVRAKFLEAIVFIGVLLISAVMNLVQATANHYCLSTPNEHIAATAHSLRHTCALQVFPWGFLGLLVSMVFGLPRTHLTVVLSAVSFICAILSPLLLDVEIESDGEEAIRLTLLGLMFLAFLMAHREYDAHQRRLFVQQVCHHKKVKRFLTSQEAIRSLTSSVLPPAIQAKVYQRQVNIDQAVGSCVVVDVPVLPRSAFSPRMAAMFATAASDIALLFEMSGVDRHTSGDVIVGTTNLVTKCSDHLDRACHLAVALVNAPFIAEVRIRIGVSSGPVVGLVVNNPYIRYDVFGKPLADAQLVALATMSGTAAADRGVSEQCTSAVFKHVNGIAYPLIESSSYRCEPGKSFAATISAVLATTEKSMTNLNGSADEGSMLESSAGAMASGGGFKWSRFFLQEAALDRLLKAKLVALSTIRDFGVVERFTDASLEDKLWRARSSTEAFALCSLFCVYFCLMVVSMLSAAAQTSQHHIENIDPSFGIALHGLCGIIVTFAALWTWGAGNVTPGVTLCVLVAVFASELGAGLMRPTTSSSEPLYLLFINQLMLSALALRPLPTWTLIVVHSGFFVAMQYVNGNGLEKIIDYVGVLCNIGIAIVHERHRHWRDRSSFVAQDVASSIAQLQDEQNRLKFNIIRSIIPKPFVSEALASTNHLNVVSSTGFPEVVVGYIRFDQLAIALADVTYYERAMRAIHDTCGVVEDLLRESNVIEPLSIRGDVICVAGPLLRTANTVLRSESLHQAADEMIRLYETLAEDRHSTFTFVAECEQGTGVLAHARYPTFFLTGTAINNARSILRDSPAGTHIATESFSKLCTGYASSVLRSPPVKWKLRGLGTLQMIPLKPVSAAAPEAATSSGKPALASNAP